MQGDLSMDNLIFADNDIYGELHLTDLPQVTQWMIAHIKCPRGHIDLNKYVENDKQQGSTRLSMAEIHALESLFYGLNCEKAITMVHAVHRVENDKIQKRYDGYKSPNRDEVLMDHGADRFTLLVICRDGFDISACNDGKIWVSNSSHYSLASSKKEAHSASTQTKMKVEQLQLELTNARAREGTAEHLEEQLQSVPMRSMAMLICKARVTCENAVKFYPFRPPAKAPSETTSATGTVADLFMPAFLIHFS